MGRRKKIPTAPETSQPVPKKSRQQLTADLPSQTSAGVDSHEPRTYGLWSTEQEGQLIEWLEDPANYALYKGAGKKNNLRGKLKTTETTKAAVFRKISVYLAEHAGLLDVNKIVNLERGYKAALVFLGGTGSGCHNPDPERPTEEKMVDATTRGIVLNHCPYWDRLNPVCSDRASMVPPHASDSLGAMDEEAGSDEQESNESGPVVYNDTVPPEVDLSRYMMICHAMRFQFTTAKSAVRSIERKTTGNPDTEHQKPISIAEALQIGAKDQLALSEKRLMLEEKKPISAF
ncbi:LOW QUALITY PROTEIN: hypothetical protein RvY_11846 [Ramazzottius varieornatus]|uniref:Uncharacterized protein n=1 Tax=Ramazzottius varieornatus TaxID=947166 RepID=A0A1D1VRA0_RAMVA|nr:LOW QUALITY PROTEIN: hypothetical protein RvY_11846 [Ramazzottius varieornatus]